MAELSKGATTCSSCSSEEAKVCPICLEPVPPLTWQLDFRKRSNCCGAVTCSDCTLSLVRRGQMIQKALDRGDVLDDKMLQDIEAVKNSIRCPICRTPMPDTNNGESLAMLQSTSERHPNWVWPLYLMGEHYELGHGCPKDFEKCFFYYRKAAERGDVRSQNKMGNFYYFGDNGVAQSTQDAIYWYTLASKQGFASSQYTLGHICFDQGNYDEAFRLLSLAAEQGVHQAQCMLATCYVNGLGVAPSTEKFLYWNKKAAEQGNTEAMNHFAAEILSQATMANGVTEVWAEYTVPEALYWARKAMSLGYEDAARLVAELEVLTSKLCANCERTKEAYPTMKLSMCSQCKATAYCSKECQAAHWRKGHKWECIDRNGVKKSKTTTGKGR